MISESIKVLLVDTNPKEAQNLSQLLHNSVEIPFQVTHVRVLSEALKNLSKIYFDIILLDLSRPDTDGLKAVRDVYAAVPSVPIVTLINNYDKDLIIQAKQLGSQGYIVKGQSNIHILAQSLSYLADRKKAEEVLRSKTQQLEAVSGAMMVFLQRGNWNEATSTLLRCALNQTSSEYGFIGVMVAGPKLRILAHEGIVWSEDVNREFYEKAVQSYQELGYLEFDNFQNLFGQVILSKKEVLSNDPRADLRKGGLPPGHPPLRHFLGVPIFRENEVVGLIGVANRHGGYTGIEQSKIRIISQALGVLYDSYRRAERENILEENRKQVAESLRQTNQMLEGLIEASPLAILLLDPDGTVRMWNPAAERIFGWTQEEVLGQFLPIIPEDKQTEFRTNLAGVFQGQVISGMETRRQKKGGIPIEISLWTVELTDIQGNKRCLSIVADNTEKIKLREELLKIQKLESLGLLAGGIAHDFNNILTGILGNISLAKTWMNSEDRAFHRLEEAEKASHRATDLARQLLTFARGGAPIKKTAPILKVLENSVKFALRGSNILSEFSFQKDLWPVEIDEGQISQVIQNLAINAHQAMPVGGKIQVKARNKVIEENKVEGLSLRKGNYVEISIQDQGVGIPKDLLSKIFDPYFTTKQTGSGLGLAISHSIIQRHDGFISVKSKLGKGTTFSIFLPASPYAVVLQDEGKEELVWGQGKVLIMDDEESVLNVAAEMLRHLGYEVETALSGTKALEKYRKAKDAGKPFDVVITDLTVPGDIGGIEVLERLKKIDSQVRVIVSSGYSNDSAISNFNSYGFSDFIVKPYRIIDISKTLQKVAERKK
jgi:two-component system cell cycle sensor histidine kinase/response regulator CckA